MTELWLSNNRMCVFAKIDSESGDIVDTSPITRKFMGQSIRNLVIWMRNQGGLHIASFVDDDFVFLNINDVLSNYESG